MGTCSRVSTAIRCHSSVLSSLVPVLKPTEDTVIFIFNTHTHPQVNNHTPIHQPNEPASVNSGPSPAHSAHRWPGAASQGKCDRIVPAPNTPQELPGALHSRQNPVTDHDQPGLVSISMWASLPPPQALRSSPTHPPHLLRALHWHALPSLPTQGCPLLQIPAQETLASAQLHRLSRTPFNSTSLFVTCTFKAARGWVC